MRKLLIILAVFGFPIMGHAGYLGGGAGTSTLDFADESADRVDDEDGYVRVFGGAEISPNLGAEFGYVDFGEFSAHYPSFDETDTATATAFTVSALAKADLTPQLNAFFKFGLAFWNAEIDAVAFDPFFFGNISGSGSGSGNETFFGAGIGLDIGERAGVRVEIEKYKDIGKGVNVTFEDIGSVELEGGDVDLFGVALIIKLE